jgi:hypothetical protein
MSKENYSFVRVNCFSCRRYIVLYGSVPKMFSSHTHAKDILHVLLPCSAVWMKLCRTASFVFFPVPVRQQWTDRRNNWRLVSLLYKRKLENKGKVISAKKVLILNWETGIVILFSPKKVFFPFGWIKIKISTLKRVCKKRMINCYWE